KPQKTKNKKKNNFCILIKKKIFKKKKKKKKKIREHLTKKTRRIFIFSEWLLKLLVHLELISPFE
ncbi:MAG: hypothetical protein JXR27_00125, partial [Paludibacteraceae bacterium]|nr:hypothetical protein [Paludibacteraceae bacterium]